MVSEEGKKIKVLIADDSAVSRKLFQRIISMADGFEVIGVARDGSEAIEKVLLLKPDVVSMDINMPNTDGIEATKKIMNSASLPIIIVSSLYNKHEKDLAVKALAAGAVHIMSKPHGITHPHFEKDCKNYIRMLKIMSEVKVVSRKDRTAIAGSVSLPAGKRFSAQRVRPEIVVIGSSAGGPQVLKILLENIPENFPLPVVIVQHMEKSFSTSFNSWLNTYSKMPVSIARNGETVVGGNVYIAPGGNHLEFRQKGVLSISPEIGNSKEHTPSVARLFKSVMNIYKDKTLAIMLSGMGRDGSEEMLQLRETGAYTIAQSESSCMVFGMPGEVVKKGGASVVLNPEEIIEELKNLVK